MGMLSDIAEYCGSIIGFDMVNIIFFYSIDAWVRGLVDIAFLLVQGSSKDHMWGVACTLGTVHCRYLQIFNFNG